MAAQLEKSSSMRSDRDSPMAAFQRSASSVKESTCINVPVLQRNSSLLKGSPPPEKLRPLPSLNKEGQGKSGHSEAIRNRNIAIGVLSSLLFLAVVVLPWEGSVGPAYIAKTSNVGKIAVGVTGNVDPFQSKWANAARTRPYHHYVKRSFFGGSKFLVSGPAISVTYHDGPILAGKGGVLKVHVIYYGAFAPGQKATISDFLQSFSAPKATAGHPTVAGWWAITKGYTDGSKVPVAQTVVPGSVYEDAAYSLGKSLQQADVEKLVTSSLGKGLVLDPAGVYVVLTSADVNVQGFCSSQCGTHLYTFPSAATQSHVLPYAWVGNAEKLCAGYCAWPYAKPLKGTGPDVPPLKAPSGDVGVDGMIINIASLLVGAATNPYATAYFQGDATDPLEAAGACGGIYGSGAYPGYAGQLLSNPTTGSSFNVYGVNGREFLVPWVFNPVTQKCAGQV
ncbi:protein PHOSPHATE-INDUCED 1 [Physcomitrium patens]|uniref:Uncharacterized protein n=1 Tax=Physcomitrium patens TaxID=3218 RepID=A0A2K1KXE0_PHYPA|nr:protein EXORDIUM-like [Physcomitrium patens]PNR58452.1 hypothetical protein PHYPA_005447 [Physcomitrium patens]|eukprot:XP_024372265.1 protein EXORDIUM-like [Physcomitrella patens]